MPPFSDRSVGLAKRLTDAAVEDGLVQDPVRHGDREEDSEKEIHEYVVPAIVLDDGIIHQVRVVDGCAFDDDVGMLAGQKPSDMSEETATS